MKKIGRKIYHLTGGLVLIGIYSRMERASGLLMLAGVFAFATALDFARLKVPSFNELMYRRFSMFIRDSERDTLTGTPWYVLGILCAAAFYDAPVAVYAVAFLACGDMAATTVGERWGTVKISGKKSLQGTLAFVGVACASGFIVSAAGFELPPAVFVTGAVVAAAVEVAPAKINDNLSVPVISGGVMKLLLMAGV